MDVHREIEHTYDPPADAALPDLRDLRGVADVSEPVTDVLEAVYFDTPELVLARSRVTLRRRTGGHDAGWHLKVPAGAGRDEIQRPLTDDTHEVPGPLQAAVRAWCLGERLVPVARVRSTRTTYRLRDEEARVLAEAVDDHVDATVLLGEPRALAWREWEVELVDAGPELLDGVDALMSEHGAPLAAVDRKLARVLGELLPEPLTAPEPRRAGPVKDLVHARLLAQVEELKRRDGALRRGEPGALHKLRVTMRRLRAALATFRPVVDRSVTDPARQELRWAARALGEARDADVLCELVDGLVAEEPVELASGAARGGVSAELRARARDAHGTAEEVLDSPRYELLLRGLDELVADPPWTGPAQEPVDQVAPRRVLKDWKRLRGRARAVRREQPGTPAHDAALHQVRKAAKRLRYSAEALEPVYGKRAARLRRRAKEVQSVLGRQHDTVVAREELLRLATSAQRAGTSTFLHGRLHARLEHAAPALLRRYDEAWAALDRKSTWGWLRRARG